MLSHRKLCLSSSSCALRTDECISFLADRAMNRRTLGSRCGCRRTGHSLVHPRPHGSSSQWCTKPRFLVCGVGHRRQTTCFRSGTLLRRASSAKNSRNCDKSDNETSSRSTLNNSLSWAAFAFFGHWRAAEFFVVLRWVGALGILALVVGGKHQGNN